MEKNDAPKKKGKKNGPGCGVVGGVVGSDTANNNNDDDNDNGDRDYGDGDDDDDAPSLLDRFANELRCVWENEVLTKRLNSEDRAMLGRQGPGKAREGFTPSPVSFLVLLPPRREDRKTKKKNRRPWGVLLAARRY